MTRKNIAIKSGSLAVRALQIFTTMSQVRIGISGWNYAPWRGVFFPKKLPYAQELEFASRQVSSIEVNGSFYALQKPASYQRWYASTPDDFIFSIKASRYITHTRRLREIDVPLANFFASGILALEEKLGPILWQFPPSMKWNEDLFREFFELLPRNFTEAAKLAKTCDSWMKGRDFTKPKSRGEIRHCVEIRNPSFMNEDWFKLLKRYNVAFVISDSGGKWPYRETITSNFTYLRLHGPEELYTSGYTEDALSLWSKKIKKWSKSNDVFVYFDNDVKVYAPFDAMKLAEKFKALRKAA